MLDIVLGALYLKTRKWIETDLVLSVEELESSPKVTQIVHLHHLFPLVVSLSRLLMFKLETNSVIQGK